VRGRLLVLVATRPDLAPPVSSASPEVTVAVCTLNRGPKIERTFASLLRQGDPGGGFEILVVDNGSSPDRKSVV